MTRLYCLLDSQLVVYDEKENKNEKNTFEFTKVIELKSGISTFQQIGDTNIFLYRVSSDIQNVYMVSPEGNELNTTPKVVFTLENKADNIEIIDPNSGNLVIFRNNDTIASKDDKLVFQILEFDIQAVKYHTPTILEAPHPLLGLSLSSANFSQKTKLFTFLVINESKKRLFVWEYNQSKPSANKLKTKYDSKGTILPFKSKS